MRRAGFTFILLIALAIACEPLIHTHPLAQTAPSPCAVCVASIGRVTPLVATAPSPLVVVSAVTPLVTHTTISDAHTSLASRAPPAA